MWDDCETNPNSSRMIFWWQFAAMIVSQIKKCNTVVHLITKSMKIVALSLFLQKTNKKTAFSSRKNNDVALRTSKTLRIFDVFCKNRWTSLCCRSKLLKNDENSCTVDICNEKLIQNIEFPLAKTMISHGTVCLYTCEPNIDQIIVRRLWVDCESDVESSLGCELVPKIKLPGTLENREKIGKQLWGDCESIVSRK